MKKKNNILVSESLFEFKKGLNPIDSLGLSRRAQIEEWLKQHNINKYKINNDYTIDVEGNVYLNFEKMRELPEFIQFGIIHGSFFIDCNRLITLRGCPQIVEGTFTCSNNCLKSLEFSPIYVGEIYVCYNNTTVFTKDDVKKVCKVKKINKF